jgi:hypothetical protein
MRRVLFHGYKIGICPLARIVHDCDNPGVRVRTEQEKERRRQLPLLIRFTDVCNNESIFSYKWYLLRKWIVSLIRGKRKIAKRHWRDFIFLNNHQAGIQKSRSINMEKGETWL